MEIPHCTRQFFIVLTFSLTFGLTFVGAGFSEPHLATAESPKTNQTIYQSEALATAAHGLSKGTEPDKAFVWRTLVMNSLVMGISAKEAEALLPIAVAVSNKYAKQKWQRTSTKSVAWSNQLMGILPTYTRHRVPSVRAAAFRGLAAMQYRGNKRLPAADRGTLSTDWVMIALNDNSPLVRSIAIEHIETTKDNRFIDELVTLFSKGDNNAGKALIAFANKGLAYRLARLAGQASGDGIADVVWQVLSTTDSKKDSDRLDLVRLLARLPSTAARDYLQKYVDMTPEKPIRKSRLEAVAFLKSMSSTDGGTADSVDSKRHGDDRSNPKTTGKNSKGSQ